MYKFKKLLLTIGVLFFTTYLMADTICKPGHEKNKNGYCERICEKGYQPNSNDECEIICELGYLKIPGNNTCKKICTPTEDPKKDNCLIVDIPAVIPNPLPQDWSDEKIYWGDAERTSAIIECDFRVPAIISTRLGVTAPYLNCVGPKTHRIVGYDKDNNTLVSWHPGALTTEIAPTLALGPVFDANGDLVSELRMWAWDWSWTGDNRSGKYDGGWVSAGAYGSSERAGGIRYLDTNYTINTEWTRDHSLTTDVMYPFKWEWYGGEVNQKTGEIYMNGGERIDASVNTGHYPFQSKLGILTPATNHFVHSGVLTPKTPADAVEHNSKVVSDMAIDAEGNFYLFSAPMANPIGGDWRDKKWWLIKIYPKRDANKTVITGGNQLSGTPTVALNPPTSPTVDIPATPSIHGSNGWEYVKVASFPGSQIGTGQAYDFFGMSFLNGKLYVSGGVGSPAAYPGKCLLERYCVLELNPLKGEVKYIGQVPHDLYFNAYNGQGWYSAVRDFTTAQMAPVISGRVYYDADGDGILTQAEKDATDKMDMSHFTIQVYQEFKNGNTTEHIYQGGVETSYSGEYSLMLPSRNATFHVRLKQPQINGANVMQTWASGGRFAWTKKNRPGNNTVTPICHNDVNLTDKKNAQYNVPGFYHGDEHDYWDLACYGVKSNGIDSTNNILKTSNFLTKVVITTDMAVARADFAVSGADRSDAPESFGEVSHAFTNKRVYLGDDVDADLESMASENATKDNFDDSVTIQAPGNNTWVTIQDFVFESEKTYKFRVATNSNNGSLKGYLNAWISISNTSSNNTNFTNGIKIADNVATSNSTHTEFNFVMPKVGGHGADNTSKAFTRFRYSSHNATNLMSTSPSKESVEANTQPWVLYDGEVEDYMFTYHFVDIRKPAGKAIIVYDGFPNDRTSIDMSNHTDIALYTQVAGVNFNVTFVNTDGVGNKVRDIINISSEQNGTIDIIKTPASDLEEDCKKAKVLQSGIWGGNITDKIFNLNVTNVDKTLTSRSATFRVTYYTVGLEDEANKVYSCSPDSFAIRPAEFTIANPTNKLLGGKNETIEIESKNINGVITPGYNQTITNIVHRNHTLDMSNTINCNKNFTRDGGIFNLDGGNFVNGISNVAIFYNNIGDLKVKFADSNWAEDSSNDVSNGDCIVGNNTNVHNANKKVGCNIEVDKKFTFYPTKFYGALDIKNFNGGDFTYISQNSNHSKVLLNNEKMWAIINGNITAKLFDDNDATNYHEGCWSKDVNYELEIDDKIDGWAYLDDKKPRDNSMFFKADNSNADLGSVGQYSSTHVNVDSGKFNNGTAIDLKAGLNFVRAVNIAQNPFTVNGTNLNFKNVSDGDITTENATTREGTAKFYYGRVYSIDYVGSSQIDATLRYEGYCARGCNTVIYDALSSSDKNPNERNWYINKEHNSLVYGNADSLKQYSRPSNANNNIIINPAQSVNIGGGKESGIKLTHNNPPYADDIIIEAQSWLIYNKRDPRATTNKFNVEFIGKGGEWVGVGSVSDDAIVGRNVTIDASNRTRQKLDW